MHPAEPRLILPEPPESLKSLSQALVNVMRERAGDRGTLSFHDFMEMALYEPGLGYYSAGLEKLGRDGDFVTAPELGDVFARCLAMQVGETGSCFPGAWDILELGAGSGRLAADLIRALPPDRRPHRYRILERSADLRAVQRKTIEIALPDDVDRFQWLDTPPEEDWQGILLANEVIDALPVDHFSITDDKTLQWGVAFSDEQLTWTQWPAPEYLVEQVAHVAATLPHALPPDYRSELCPTLHPWLHSVSERMEKGLVLLVDYGYPRGAYYRRSRHEGTLVCHYRHRAHFDPLWWPGLQDITAFVDFTAVAEAADATGLEVAGYCSQAMFLMGCGLESVLSDLASLPPEAQHALAHQVRELTLPGAMGEKFQVMGLTRDIQTPLRGFGLEDLRGHL